MSQENAEIVHRLHEAFEASGLAPVRDALASSSSPEGAAASLDELGELVLAHVDRDVDLLIDAASFSLPDMPAGTRFHGLDGWVAFWRAWLEAWESFDVEYVTVVAEGDEVVIDKTIEAIGRGSGLEVKVTHAEVWTIRDRRVVRVAIYETCAEALKAIGPSERL